VTLSSGRNFRAVALLEATSFLVLLVATHVKYAEGEPIGVQILGPLHGVLFIAYLLLAVDLGLRAEWGARTMTLLLLGAILPFGGYAVERWLAERPTAAAPHQ